MRAAVGGWMRIVAVICMFLAMSSAARADDDVRSSGPPGVAPYVSPPAYAYAEPPTREVRYGATTLAIDGLAVGLIAIAAAHNDGGGIGAVSLGLSAYFFGAPITHLAHGEPGAAFASLGLRGLLPFVGAIVAHKIGPKDHAVCDGDGCDTATPSPLTLAIGVGLGALAASVIDARVIARKRVVDRSPQFAPTAAVTPHGFSVGLGGSF